MMKRTRHLHREREHVGKRRKSEEKGVIPGRIWLVLGSLWGEVRCNPLLSMHTWAEFHQIPLVAENHRGQTGYGCVWVCVVH